MKIIYLKNVANAVYLLDTGCKLKLHMTFRRLPGRLTRALCTFNSCLMPKRWMLSKTDA